MTPEVTYFADKKKLAIKQKALIGAGVGLAVFAIALERKRVNKIVLGFMELIAETENLSQAAVEETMWRSFDEGVKYGLQLAPKLTNGPDAELGRLAAQAFDKTA